jgi:hypothetical protein
MKSLLLLSSIVFSQLAFANGDHYHPKKILKCSGECSEAQVRAIVPEALEILVKAKEVKDQWKTVPVEKIEKRKFSKRDEWVVILFNKMESSNTKQRLYMFISLDGWLNGANNTGK